MFSAARLVIALSLVARSFATLSCTDQNDGGATTLWLFSSVDPYNSMQWRPGFDGSFTVADAIPGSTDTALILSGVNGYPFHGDNFLVSACDSSFMGYPATTTGSNGLPIQYGHLAFQNTTTDPATDPTCVTLVTGSDGSGVWANKPCSTADDESQLAQFFQFSILNDDFEEEVINVTFLGAPASAGTSGNQYFAPSNTTDEAALLLAKDEPTGYYLQLQFVHVN